METRFLTNDVEHDPQVHDHEWAKRLGLVAFSGYRLKPPDSDVLGVFALFTRFPISPDMDAILDGLSHAISLAIQKDVAEEALRESEKKFRLFFNNVNDAIYLHSINEQGLPGKFLEVNEVMCRRLEYNRDELLTMAPQDVLSESGRSKMPVIAAEIAKQGQATFETEHRRKDGSILPVEVSTLIFTLGGERVALASARDITERKKAEEALRESEQKFRDIFNNTADAIILHEIGVDGKPGKFTDINDVMSRMLEYTREEMLTKTPLDITTDYHYPSLEKIFEEQRTNGRARFETEYQAKDGTIIPVEVHTQVVIIHGKKLMLGAVRDITARKRAEEALRQVNKKLNLLSSITRHDINNQLTVLLGYLELSKDSLEDVAKISEYLIKEEQAAKAIQRQIIFTKEYQDLGVKDPVWHDVETCIKKSLTVLPIRDIRIIAEVNDLEVFADLLFEKVFYNLIDNALRYGGHKMTTIHITSQETGQKLVISVQDDGEGISTEDKKRLFERGFGHHTGLGLFLSREILAITGITINETGEPGNGARFEIVVPKGGYRFAARD